MKEIYELDSIHLLIVVITSLLTCATIGGNLVVMLAIIFKPKLRQNVTNCFIASLAAADLLLGTIVMPFAIVEYWRGQYYEHMNYSEYDLTKSNEDFVLWPYGQTWCDLWHAFDVLCCTASILNLCVIAVERYVAISDPFTYQSRITHKKSILMITMAWLLSALISFPAIAWWQNSARNMENGNHKINTNITMKSFCVFPEDQLYLFLSSCVSFHIPLIIMGFVYWRVYRTATMVLKSLTRGSKVVNNGKKDVGGEIIIQIHRGGGQREPMLFEPVKSSVLRNTIHSETSRIGNSLGPSADNQDIQGSITPGSATYSSSCIEKHVRFTSFNLNTRNRISQPFIGLLKWNSCCCHLPDRFMNELERRNQSIEVSDDEYQSGSNSKTPRLFSLKKRIHRFMQEKRAAKTLGLIMGTFIICWLPFFVYNTIKSICPSLIRENDTIIFPLVTWLGYVNSSINPFIYAYSLRDMRRTFRELICMGCEQKSVGRLTLTNYNRNCQHDLLERQSKNTLPVEQPS